MVYDVIWYKILLDRNGRLPTPIKQLKEYRQSLISEAVTGKIDVRDWQPPKTSPLERGRNWHTIIRIKK